MTRSSPDTISPRTEALKAIDEMDKWAKYLWKNAKRPERFSDDGVTQDGAAHIAEAIERWLKPIRASLQPATPTASGGDAVAADADLSQIVQNADWHASVGAHSGLAFHLAKYWPQLRASIRSPDAAATAQCSAGSAELADDIENFENVILSTNDGEWSDKRRLTADEHDLVVAALRASGKVIEDLPNAAQPSSEQKRIEDAKRITLAVLNTIGGGGDNLAIYEAVWGSLLPSTDHQPGCQSGDFGPCDCGAEK